MPEPIFIAATLLGSAFCVPRHRTGLSHEAEAISEANKEMIRRAEQSQSLFGGKSSLISRAFEMFNECQPRNWDGYDSDPVKLGALREAIAFIRACPAEISLPEIAPDPDGSICLEWITSRRRMLSLSLDGTGRVAFAWLDGTDKGHGVAKFDSEQIPSRILEAIHSIKNARNAGFRIA